MSGMTRTGWYADPTRRHRVRYRDGDWTAWVADALRPFEDEAGLDVALHDAERRRRIGWVISIAAIVVGGLILVGCIALINDAETSGISEVRSEMSGWNLPPTVARSKPDNIARGAFGASGPTVTRYFKAVGTTTDVAVLDLVRALRSQGYSFYKTTDRTGPSWTGDCHFNASYCFFDIRPYRDRIEVEAFPNSS